MLKRSLALVACAAVLTACGQSAPSQTPTAPVRVSDVACTMDYERPQPQTELATVVAHNGWMLQADAGVLECGELSAEGVSCQASPGSVFYGLQDYWWYDVPEGRTATITVGDGGSPACFLNEEG